MQRKAYPSDLSDAEWEKLESLFPAAKPIGSPRQVDLREVMNAIFYWADNRVKWRALPDDFPAEKILADQGDRGDLAEAVAADEWVSTGTHKQAPPRRFRSSTLALDSRAQLRLARKCQTLVSRLRGATRKS